MIRLICSERLARPVPPAFAGAGVGAAIIMPAANAEAMNQHLTEISTQVAPGAHAVVVCDRAGWHQTGGRLHVPDNITLLPLPSYAPRTNPMENVWEYLRGNKLSRLVWDTLYQLSSRIERDVGNAVGLSLINLRIIVAIQACA